MTDADYFLALQTQTGWGRVLARFADWCRPHKRWLTLDVGTGPGLLPALFSQAGCCSFGVDLDPKMFYPKSLHPDVAIANSPNLPFPSQAFDLVSASNLLFLLDQPLIVLEEMTHILQPDGQLVLLNPSESLSVDAATEFAEQRGLQGLARKTLINWAVRAETHNRWTEIQLHDLFASVGLELIDTTTAVGPGFARFARGHLC